MFLFGHFGKRKNQDWKRVRTFLYDHRHDELPVTPEDIADALALTLAETQAALDYLVRIGDAVAEEVTEE